MSVEFGDKRLPPRFWDKVSPEPNSGCWLWSGSVAHGYGQFSLPGRKLARCNRLIASLAHGPLKSEQHVCHSCDNPSCCNPEHLWVGTASDNMRDCYRKGRHPERRKRRLLCKRGHALTTANRGHRGQCRECRRDRAASLKTEGKN